MLFRSRPGLGHCELRRDEFWRTIPAWAQVSAAEFGNHQWQQRHTITNVRQLRDALGTVVPENFYTDLEAGIEDVTITSIGTEGSSTSGQLGPLPRELKLAAIMEVYAEGNGGRQLMSFPDASMVRTTT